MADAGVTDRFRDLYASPSSERLCALSSGEFERFVADAFHRAGYEVSRPRLNLGGHAMLELSAPGNGGKPSGIVALKHVGPDGMVPKQIVQWARHNRAVQRYGVPAYVVTTGGYEKDACDYAASSPPTYLLNAVQFCRYIRYVQHSRYETATGVSVVIPPDRFAELPIARGTSSSKAIVLAIANNKGGVGKTTTARHLGLGLAARNKRVLLVDLDPQGNLTEMFLDTSSKMVSTPHLAHYFAGTHTLEQLTRPTSFPGIVLIPAHPDLRLLDTGGAGRPDVEMRFATDLIVAAISGAHGTDRKYDWIILDTPPAISMFTRAALAAADYVIAPARSRPSSLAGIDNMLLTMDTMGELVGTPPHLIGGLITHWSEDQNSTDTYARLEERFSRRHSRVLAQEIPYDVTVEKLHGQTHHKASNAYEQVVEEVLTYVERK